MFLLSSAEITLLVIGCVLLILVIWGIATRNTLKRMEIKVEEGASGIDVALTQRYDTLTKMLDVTKAYAKHESETLEAVIKARKGLSKNASMEEVNSFASELNDVQKGINVVCEQYPQLRSDAVFKKLEDAIQDIEERLQAARRLYNANVSSINQKIITFPTSIIANMCNVRKKVMFEAEDKKRQDVEMKF